VVERGGKLLLFRHPQDVAGAALRMEKRRVETFMGFPAQSPLIERRIARA
jgi:hypothetical protein